MTSKLIISMLAFVAIVMVAKTASAALPPHTPTLPPHVGPVPTTPVAQPVRSDS